MSCLPQDSVSGRPTPNGHSSSQHVNGGNPVNEEQPGPSRSGMAKRPTSESGGGEAGPSNGNPTPKRLKSDKDNDQNNSQAPTSDSLGNIFSIMKKCKIKRHVLDEKVLLMS